MASILIGRYPSTTDAIAAATPHTYTYKGEDYPIEYPIGHLETVTMILQESIHYSANLSDAESNSEWKSLSHHPEGFGRTRLGPDNRMFVVTAFHQVHCLQILHSALGGNMSSAHHVQHCLDYLRQTFLCEAADNLEPGDFLRRDFTRERLAGEVACRDWEKVYRALDEDAARWEEWSLQWN